MQSKLWAQRGSCADETVNLLRLRDVGLELDKSVRAQKNRERCTIQALPLELELP